MVCLNKYFNHVHHLKYAFVDNDCDLVDYGTIISS